MKKKLMFAMPFLALLACFCLSMSSCCNGEDDDFLGNDGIMNGNQGNNGQDAAADTPYTYSFGTGATQDLLDLYDTDVTITTADGTVTTKRLSEPNEVISFDSDTYQDFNVVYKSVLKNDAVTRINDSQSYIFPLSTYTINVVNSKGKVVYSHSGGEGTHRVTGSRLKNNLNYFARNYELRYRKDKAELEQQSYNNVEYVDKDANSFEITEGETFVNLGLSVKWASKNLVIEPNVFNNNSYFAWGEVKPKKGNYTWSNYDWTNTSTNTMSKYNVTDGLTRLEINNDAAFSNRDFYGGNDFCRMPTVEEARELIKECKWTWGIYDGQRGYKVEGKNGNSIFLPAAGIMEEKAQTYFELYGMPRGYRVSGSYWTCDLKETGDNNYLVACCLCFENTTEKEDIIIYKQPRYAGCTIRAVCTR